MGGYTRDVGSECRKLERRNVNKQWYHCRGWHMKGSLGIDIFFCFFPENTWLSFSYMVAYDLICDKDF